MPGSQGPRRPRHTAQALSRRRRYRVAGCDHRRRLRLRIGNQRPRRLQLAGPELRGRDGLHSRRRDLHLWLQPRRLHRPLARRLHQHLRSPASRRAADGQRALANLLPHRARARASQRSAHRSLPGPAPRVQAHHRSGMGSVARSPEGSRRTAGRPDMCQANAPPR